MIMINSSTLESDSAKHLCISINPLTEKFDDINNNHYQKDKTSFDSNNIIKQDSLSSSSNDTTLLTTTTTMTTVEVKVKTTKTSSRKRKLNIINDNNNDNINKQQQQAITKNKKKQRVTKIDNDDNNNNNTKKKKTNNSKTIDQSSVTDESSFGSCEPGTSVVLHGIVWNETDKGILVVNITWRGKTYVGALLNTTEQNWAPPRYKSDIRTTKQNYNRDHPLSSIPSSHESTERILRNGKRRGSSTTVTPSSTTKTRSFKIPETPSSSSSKNEKLPTSSLSSSTNINDDDEANIRNTCVGGGDDEIGDNYSSRSVSPTTSGISTTSSSPPLSNNNENQSILNPIDLSNSKSTINIEENTLNSKTKDSLIPYHFTNDMLFSSSPNPSDYFSSLNGSTNSFNLQSFNKTSSNVSPSSYLPIPSQLYFNSLTSPHYTSVTSLSKSSR